MADYRVRFVGDLGNLGAFNSSIRNSLSSSASVLEQANRTVVSRSIGQSVQPSSAARSSAGLFVRNAQTQLDTYNKAIIQTGQVYRQFVQGYQTESRKFGNSILQVSKPIFGEMDTENFKIVTKMTEDYTKALSALAPVEERIRQIEKGTITGRGTAGTRGYPGTGTTATGSIGIARVNTAEENLQAFLRSPVYVQAREAENLFKLLQRSGANLGALTADVLKPAEGDSGTLLTGKKYTAFQANLDKESQTILSALANQRGILINGVRAQVQALENDPVIKAVRQYGLGGVLGEGAIGTSGAELLQKYPDVRKDLIKKAGLGGGAAYGTPAFFQNAQKSQFQVTDVVKDMEKGVIRYSGSVLDADKVTNQWSYSIDKNGTAVNNWGRSLSQGRGFLNQTSRDFAKVIEWTVATTVVFGALGTIISSLSSINQLNVDLQRFSITARASAEETTTLFEGLAKVAFDTATPIKELVKAADDIALATRRANQSTTEWHTSILELANAVGILTNISGLDTVQATELLTATMKQLGVTTRDLVPLLSQITAAAGGQSNSITDIATGLSQLAEAAQEAGLTTTQQIAAIQVISQVTGKSAANTATAFKNLFGAINSDAAIKKLEEFGIAVRDQEGNLRPFLDIYKDIANAINAGIIPAGRVNEVLRAVSGGPRRSPDASALIANINKVFEVEKIAGSASNEALIANAKILDTNQAKITQFQNAFDVAVFEKFNEAIKDFTGALATLGTALAQVFGLVPTGFVTFGIELLAITAAIKLLTRGAGALGLANFFKSIKEGFGLVQKEAATTTTSLKSLSQTSIGPLKAGMSQAQLDAIVLARSAKGAAPIPNLTQNSAGQYVYAGSNKYASAPVINSYKEAFNPKVPNLVENAKGRLIYADTKRFASAADEAIFKAFSKPIAIAAEDRNLLQRLIGVFSKNAAARGGAKVAAGVGAGIGAAATGLGDVAGLVGSALLFTPATFLAGAGILAAKTAIDFWSQGVEEAKAKAKDLQSTLYDMTQQWKENQAGVDAAQETYDGINTALDKSKASLLKTKVGTSEYNTIQNETIDLQGKLGTATVELSLALAQQGEETSKLLALTKQLAAVTGDESLKTIGNISGPLTKEQLSSIIGIVSKNILEAAGQYSYKPGPIGFNSSNLNYGAPSNAPIAYQSLGSTQRISVAPETFTQSNFKELISVIRASRGLGLDPFNNPTVQFPFTNPLAVSAFQTQAATYKDNLNPADATAFQNDVINPFNEAVDKFALAGTVVAQNIQNAQAYIQARQSLGVLGGAEAAKANANLDAATGLQSLANLPGADQAGIAQIVAKLITDALQQTTITGQKDDGRPIFGKPDAFNSDLFKAAADKAIEALGIELPDGIEKTNAEASILREQFHLTDDQIIQVVGSLGNLGSSADEAAKALVDATNLWAEGLEQNLGQKQLDLQARIQGGEFKKDSKQQNFLTNQFDAEAKAILKMRDAANALDTSLGAEGAASAAGILSKELQALGVHGFEGLNTVSLKVDDLNNAFFNWITTLNLTDNQIRKAVPLWVKLFSLAAEAARLMAMAINSKSALAFWGIDSGKFFAGQISAKNKEIDDIIKQLNKIGGNAPGTNTPHNTISSSAPTQNINTIYLTDEQRKVSDPQALVKQAYQDALKLQAQIPGEKKRDKNDTVVVFDGLQKIFKARGISEELLRKALDNLTGQMAKANDKADVVRRIRVGAGDFSAIANVPVNSTSGVSIANQNQINVILNLNGANLTPAQFAQLADLIAASIARHV